MKSSPIIRILFDEGEFQGTPTQALRGIKADTPGMQHMSIEEYFAFMCKNFRSMHGYDVDLDFETFEECIMRLFLSLETEQVLEFLPLEEL